MNKVTGFLVGLLCGALLVVGILAFNQNSFASLYDIDDVMSKLDDIEFTVSSVESDVHYIKRNLPD